MQNVVTIGATKEGATAKLHPSGRYPKQQGESVLNISSWLKRSAQQVTYQNPFGGDCLPSRVPVLFASGRPCLPFPHPWNFRRPIEILETYFCGSENQSSCGKHNRFLDVPGFPPVLVSRDPGIIRAILTATGDREGQFDRDTLPSTGIARATGEDTLLFGNGSIWRRQRKASASPFGKTALFQPEIFSGFEDICRQTIRSRMMVLRRHVAESGSKRIEIAVEPEIKTLMLEMLVECFFGTSIEYEQLRERYVPSLERVIDHIVRDTVTNRLGLSRDFLARFSRRYSQACEDFKAFDDLTDRVLASRGSDRGMWKKLRTEAPDEALRSNIKVFLAGALEATTSYATWAISHLARNHQWQEAVFTEIESMADYSPEQLDAAPKLNAVLNETLRLTPSLYFLPRKATQSTRVEIADGRVMIIPPDTHILLDVWHANRHEDHWGTESTGYPASEFAPDRWGKIAAQKGQSKEFLHFGFGHGPRVCPGKHLGQLEVALAVGAFVKLFKFTAVNQENKAFAGVSTKPADGTLVELELRKPSAGMMSEEEWQRELREN